MTSRQHTQQHHQRGDPERARVRGMPQNWQPLGPCAPLQKLWSAAARVPTPPRDRAFLRHAPPDHRRSGGKRCGNLV